MKQFVIALIIAGTAGFALAGGLEQLAGGSGAGPLPAGTVKANPPVPVADTILPRSADGLWRGLMQEALENGVAMNMPVPGHGNRTSKFLMKGGESDSEPLDVFAVYGKAGPGALVPEGLYVQRIYTLPNGMLSYIFLCSLDGRLLEAYTTGTSPDGSYFHQDPVQDTEVAARFEGLKSFWLSADPGL
ncbi:MAG: hypothetical protein COT18_11785 [Elusimicrobia bacterium CG08_land_8_20_14_0_20_59_10]|nr:MAG: hypothetical protein COT18_11785 [Elusimicrobia bacterium CG08_land_8_20_14_0_20_59_10]